VYAGPNSAVFSTRLSCYLGQPNVTVTRLILIQTRHRSGCTSCTLISVPRTVCTERFASRYLVINHYRRHRRRNSPACRKTTTRHAIHEPRFCDQIIKRIIRHLRAVLVRRLLAPAAALKSEISEIVVHTDSERLRSVAAVIIGVPRSGKTAECLMQLCCRSVHGLLYNSIGVHGLSRKVIYSVSTNSSAVAKRARDVSCLSVVSFNSTIPRAQFFIISYFGLGFTSAYNSILFCCLRRNAEPCCHTHDSRPP